MRHNPHHEPPRVEAIPVTIGSVGVLGLGLIGGSIAAGLRRAGVTVWGFDVDDDALRVALNRGVLDQIVVHPSELGACEVIVVAVPPALIGEGLSELRGAPSVLTDCASVKTPVTAWASEHLPPESRGRFVGGHPMAGFERNGPENANPDLFEGAPWILTPLEDTEPGAVEAVAGMVTMLGAHPVTMDPETHDAHVALLSHLPHVLAAMLVLEAQGLDSPSVGGGSWRDLTRVAGADPDMWTQILGLNTAQVLARLDTLLDRLLAVRHALVRNDEPAIRRVFEEARLAKEATRCD